jgi:hypothetical protein
MRSGAILPLGVLRCLARPLEPGLLSLFDPGVSGEQAVLAQYRLEVFVSPYQRPGNAMTDGTALPGYAAALYLDHSIVLAQVLGDQ